MKTAKLTLNCPIRGTLKTSARAKDGLKASEEYYRVEALKHFLALGYPKSHFKIEATVKKFGNSGRNSVRSDFAILDVPANSISSGDVDALLEHAVVLCEVKRDNNKPDYVKNTQVKPLLDFAKLDGCLAIYWDNVDQRVFWYERLKNKRVLKEGPLAIAPKYGQKIHLKPLVFKDTKPSDNLLTLFDRIDNTLHSASIDQDQRFEIMLQLLLAKLHDEHGHQSAPKTPLGIQDFEAMGVTPSIALSDFNVLLKKSIANYQRYLPRKIEPKLHVKVSGNILFEICKVLAPIRLIASKREVIQTFYMKFAKGLYKWDLAQFFTPPPVTDFIVDIVNPQFGEHLKDPACGSADFLTAAFHKRRHIDPNYADYIWGADNSKNAVQVAVLNMLLNGDGKTNIKEVDSLDIINDENEKYDILVCNPPFGIRIVEKKASTLRKFDLGHEWSFDDLSNQFVKGKKLVKSQETGLLFAEACVKMAVQGGRIAIILPNGYLGNRSKKYQVFRDWILRHCRIAAICSFPRFTFKTSGADVSASIIYLEKREQALEHISQDKDYRVAIQMIENVGWNLGNKKAAPRYKRDQEDGSFIINQNGERILDADFEGALNKIRLSSAVKDFPWLIKGTQISGSPGSGWSIPASDILTDKQLTMDPKRYCEKFYKVRSEIKNSNHFKLSDVIEFVPEKENATGNKVTAIETETYQYVELQDIGYGFYSGTELHGWELPLRARHFAEPGDIYIGSIWGSVSKWCMVPENCDNTVVTNGCYRLRLKEGMQEFLPDILAFFCSESYSIQMRGFARGSDGLAEVVANDVGDVLIIKLNSKQRKEIQPFINSIKSGQPDIGSKVKAMEANGLVKYPEAPKRPSHVVLV